MTCVYCQESLVRPAGTANPWAQRIFIPAAAGSRPSPPLSHRRTIAVLVTYTWNDQGQVYPIREGRNLIGRGEECEVRLEEDATLPPVSAFITFDKGFFAGDIAGGAGTSVNGETLRQQVRTLPDRSRIRTGKTDWLFAIVDPALM